MFGFRLCIFLLLIARTWYCSGQSSNEIIVCGDHLVLIVDANELIGDPAIVWSWSAHEETEFSEEIRSTKFESIDECKPVDHGNKILITSSSGGIALIERARKQIEFYQESPNAHSAELLPNNRIAIVSSTADTGNKINIYDIKNPSTPIITDSLYSGHGVVWDDENQILYVLGYSLLKAYELVDWSTNSPKIKISSQWKIPGESGHDLQRDPNSSNLIITEHFGVWVFDAKEEIFTKHLGLSDKLDVKSVSVNPNTNEIIYVQAEEQWWARQVRFLNSTKKSLHFPEVKLYKARWNFQQ